MTRGEVVPRTACKPASGRGLRCRGCDYCSPHTRRERREQDDLRVERNQERGR